ncbi:MAG TPA: DUF4412 domain-containing protein, partial [Myxococcaceae bacterium]|nr:DUF4412 domain-containing protein [Myxococcaceae bacterium]
LLAALCLAAVPALAFEGVIDTKMTAAGGEMGGKPMSFNGSGKISIKGLNTRMDQEMNMPGVSGPMKQTVIHRADEPNVTYILHDATKTYTKLNADKDEGKQAGEGWSVKKIGKDTVAGRSTEHVQVMHQGKEPMDLWIDTALVSAGDLEKAFASGDRRQGGWWPALKKAGGAGIPLKVVAPGEHGGGMTWEATSVKSQSVPDSAFKIPAGFTESNAGMGAGMGAGSMTPEQQQQMREQMMQKLTPEQRKQVEQMMKQRQGGGQ